jgi:hypothetical protein
MRLEALSFSNYKVFPGNEILELRPLTVLIGRNSSGKSVIARLPLLLAQSLSDLAESPLDLEFQGLNFGASFVDLIHNRNPHGAISLGAIFSLDSGDAVELRSTIQHFDEYRLQFITRFELRQRNQPPIILTWDGNDPLSDTLYRDRETGTPCHVSFRGLFPHVLDIEANQGQSTGFAERIAQIRRLRSHLASTMADITYLGPFRSAPQRTYQFPGSVVRSVGLSGVRAPELLADDVLRQRGDVLDTVSQWVARYLGGWSLVILRQGDAFSLALRNPSNPSVEVNLADVGTGIAQALPLVVQRQADVIHHSAGQNHPAARIEIVEQPELHLHPGVHGDLADLYVEAVNRQIGQFIVETHSENFLLRIRRRIAEGKLDPDKTLIYWIDDESETGSQIHPIHIDINGEVDMWPYGIFSEDFDEVRAIRSAQQKVP